MPFGLKNAGATYQRLMNKMFAHQLGRNIQVYVDDMLVKSVRENDHLSDLQETFNTLRSYNMKLNPSKCVFGVTAGKFLGFMVSQRGYRSQPREGAGHNGVRAPEDSEGSSELERKSCGPEQIRLQSNR